MVAGTDFGSEARKNMLVRKLLYILKSYGTEFRAFLEDIMDEMGYMPSYANPDLWLRPEVNPDGFGYYQRILCYVDDLVCISYNPWK